jgi:hypothetical protein
LIRPALLVGSGPQSHLVDTVTGLADRGIGFRSLQEAIATTTPGGKLVAAIAKTLGVSSASVYRHPRRRLNR